MPMVNAYHSPVDSERLSGRGATGLHRDDAQGTLKERSIDDGRPCTHLAAPRVCPTGGEIYPPHNAS